MLVQDFDYLRQVHALVFVVAGSDFGWGGEAGVCASFERNSSFAASSWSEMRPYNRFSNAKSQALRNNARRGIGFEEAQESFLTRTTRTSDQTI